MTACPRVLESDGPKGPWGAGCVGDRPHDANGEQGHVWDATSYTQGQVWRADGTGLQRALELTDPDRRHVVEAGWRREPVVRLDAQGRRRR